MTFTVYLPYQVSEKTAETNVPNSVPTIWMKKVSLPLSGGSGVWRRKRIKDCKNGAVGREVREKKMEDNARIGERQADQKTRSQ